MYGNVLQLFIHIYLFFYVFPYRLLQNIEYGSLTLMIFTKLLQVGSIASLCQMPAQGPRTSNLGIRARNWPSVWGHRGFPGGAEVKNPPANAGDVRDSGSIVGWEDSPGVGHGNPFQYSCLENPMDRGAWRAIVHRVAKSQTRLKWLSIQVELMFLALGFPQNLGKIPSSMSKHSPLLCTSQFCPVYFSSFLV